MAGLLHDLVNRAQAVAAQLNVADNGRTYNTVRQNGAQYAPKAPASVAQQAVHSGASNFVGSNIVKPLLRFPIDASHLIYNTEVAPVLHLPQQNLKTNGLGLQRFARYTGANGSVHQTLGDALQTALTIGSGGLASSAERGAADLIPKVAPNIVKTVAPKVASNAALGAGYGTTSAISNGEDLPGVIKSGAEGAALGGVIPIAGKATKVAADSVQLAERARAANGFLQEHPVGLTSGAVDDQGNKLGLNGKPLQTTKPNVKQNRFTQGAKAGRQNVGPAVQEQVSGDHVVRNTAALEARGAEAANQGSLPGVINRAYQKTSVPLGNMSQDDSAFVMKAIERIDSSAAKAQTAGNTKRFEQLSETAAHLHDSLSEHSVEGGQRSQALSIMYQRSPQGLFYKAERDLNNAKVKLSPEERIQLQQLADGIKAAGDNPNAKLDALGKFHQFVSQKMPQNASDKLIGVWKAGLLSGVKTQAGNALSNATFAGLRTITDPISAGIDRGISLFTGERAKTATQTGKTTGSLSGFKRGGKTLATGIDERSMDGGKYEQHAEINFNNKAVQTVIGKPSNWVFRGMNAADQPWYYAQLKNSLYDQAKAAGLNKGLKGAELKAFMEKTATNPTEQMAQVAKTDAEKSVLGYDTLASKIISGAKSSIDKFGGQDQYVTGKAMARTALNVIAPFTRVPTAFLARTLDYSPIGYLKAITKVAEDVHAGRGLDQRSLSEALGEATTGSSVVVLGSILSSGGLVSGQYPKDPKEVQRWKAEHITPNSIKVGNTWISLNYLGPAGLLINAGHDFNEGRADGGLLSGVENSVLGTGQNLLGQSFLTGFSGFANALNDPGRYGKNLINSQVGSVVPAISNDAANFFDKFQREANGPAQTVQSRIPGLRNGLPIKEDVYGNQLQQRTDPLNLLASPFRPSDNTTGNPVIAEVTRLHAVDPSNPDLQVTPTPVKNALSVEGNVVHLDKTQQHDLQHTIGQKVQKDWNAAINSPEYQSMSDIDKAGVLSNIRRDASAVAQRDYLVNNSLATYDKQMTAKQIALDQTDDISKYLKAGSTTGATTTKTASTKKASTKTAKAKSTGSKKASTRSLTSEIAQTASLSRQVAKAKVGTKSAHFTSKVTKRGLEVYKKSSSGNNTVTVKKQLIRSLA